jgi:hypothetical protein
MVLRALDGKELYDPGNALALADFMLGGLAVVICDGRPVGYVTGGLYAWEQGARGCGVWFDIAAKTISLEPIRRSDDCVEIEAPSFTVC